jgi:hypothetical protein
MLDRIMPEPRFSEVHAVTVDASAGAVFEAVNSVAVENLPLMRVLMTVRSLPALATGRHPFGRSPGPLLEQAVEAGFMRLGEERDREIVLGLIAQPWRLFTGGGIVQLPTVDDFIAFDRPGFAKAAINFFIDGVSQPVRVRTETRVWVADAATARRFGCYWVVIRPGSGLIRREWLREIAQRAERARASGARDRDASEDARMLIAGGVAARPRDTRGSRRLQR